MTQPMTKASDNLVERLLHPTLGVMRGVNGEPSEKLLNIRVGELREIDSALRHNNARIETLTAALLEAGEALGEVTEALAQCYIEKASADGDPRLQRARASLETIRRLPGFGGGE